MVYCFPSCPCQFLRLFSSCLAYPLRVFFCVGALYAALLPRNITTAEIFNCQGAISQTRPKSNYTACSPVFLVFNGWMIEHTLIFLQGRRPAGTHKLGNSQGTLFLCSVRLFLSLWLYGTTTTCYCQSFFASFNNIISFLLFPLQYKINCIDRLNI